jgi:outer membrane cobalamin receptor
VPSGRDSGHRFSIIFGLAFAGGALLCPMEALADAETAAATDTTRIELRPTLDGGFIATEQIVRAARPDAQAIADRQPTSVTVLELADYTGSMQTLGGVLREAAGLSVRESGGVGGYAALSLRGSSSLQVPVFLDGIPLADPAQGGVNLNDIPLQAIASIEIYRGSAPLVLGNGSLGGAVHLRSHSGRHPRSITFSRGSFGHRELSGNASLQWSDWVVDLRARALRNDGNWEFLDDRGTIYNSQDDQRRLRLNNRVEGGGLLAHGLRPLGTWTLRVQLMADLREQGTPGYSVRQSLAARSKTSTLHSRVAFVAPRAQPWWRELSVFAREDGQRFDDPSGDFGGAATDRRDHTRRLGARVVGKLGGDNDQQWSLSLEQSRLLSLDELRSPGKEGRQTRWSAASAFEPSVSWRNLLIRPGLRLERTADRIDSRLRASSLDRLEVGDVAQWSTSAQVGARWQWSPALALKANLARSERTPTLLERFGNRGTVVGNPELRPERGVQRDLGLVWRPRAGVRFALSAFDNDAFDLIAYEANSPVSTRPVNIGRADLRGIEVEADFGRHGPFDTRLTLTRVNTRDRSDRSYARNAPLPGRPGLEFLLLQGVHLRSSRVQWELRAVGDNYLQTGRRERVPSRAVASLDLRVPMSALRWVARVENLTDVETYDLWNFPLPGRHFSVALRWGNSDEGR